MRSSKGKLTTHGFSSITADHGCGSHLQRHDHWPKRAQQFEPGWMLDLTIYDDRSDVRPSMSGRRSAHRDRRQQQASAWPATGTSAQRFASRRSSPSSIKIDMLSSGHLAGHLTAFLKDPRIGLVAIASTSIDNEGRDTADMAARGPLGPIDKVLSPGESPNRWTVATTVPLLWGLNPDRRPRRCGRVQPEV